MTRFPRKALEQTTRCERVTLAYCCRVFENKLNKLAHQIAHRIFVRANEFYDVLQISRQLNFHSSMHGIILSQSIGVNVHHCKACLRNQTIVRGVYRPTPPLPPTHPSQKKCDIKCIDCYATFPDRLPICTLAFFFSVAKFDGIRLAHLVQ